MESTKSSTTRDVIASDSVIAEYVASAVIELRRLGMNLPASAEGNSVMARLYTYAEMFQALMANIESLEKKGRALL